MIAPTFESLSTKYSKPGKIAFCKVNVDNQGEVAQQHGVRAMPTFLVLRNGSVIETVQGANPPALTAAVEKAVKLAGPGAGSGAVFSSPGHRLGGSGVGAKRPSAMAAAGSWSLKGLVDALIAFFGLYFVSLFSVGLIQESQVWTSRRLTCAAQLDPYKAAENSPFNKTNLPPRVQPGSGARPGARPGFKTLSDLGSS